ncbi:MAG TPA: hypothetical protein VGG73_03445 [Vicinamibacterales bacterium]
MNIRKTPGDHLYAVAVRDASELWLVLWVRHSARGEYFVFHPHNERPADWHLSYHKDGRVHSKNYGHKMASPFFPKRQPLTAEFRGSESLITIGGYAPKTLGAICALEDFTGVVELGPRVLGPKHGQIAVDLVEPGFVLPRRLDNEAARALFTEPNPNVLIRVFQ